MKLSIEARTRFAIKFVRQSYRKGLNVHCHVATESEAQNLDQLLWDDQESFIPHEINQGDSPKAPVGIGWQDPAESPWCIGEFRRTLPPWFSQFDHLIEIVVQNPDVLKITRTNWKN